MADARPALGPVQGGKGKGVEEERPQPKPAINGLLRAALKVHCEILKETSHGRIGTSATLDKILAPGAPTRKEDAPSATHVGQENLIKDVGLVPDIPTIIESFQKRILNQYEEMQKMVAAEEVLEKAVVSSPSDVQPYKRRRIVSSELMSNTKYYMARAPDSLHPTLGDLSLGTRSFKRRVTPSRAGTRPFDLISSLASYNILTAEMVKHLHPREVLTLYSISRVFHATWNASELSFARIMASYADATAAVAYPWDIYRDYLIRNPKGYIDIDYTQPSWTRGRDIDKPEEWSKVVSSQQGVRLEGHSDVDAAPIIEDAPQATLRPRFCVGLAWVNMLIQRERQSRDILAVMARKGHLVPRTMRWTLRKLWVLLDCSTNSNRIRAMATWSYYDLFNAQLFLVKLSMMFCGPVRGVGFNDLRKLILGQPTGLRCLWQLLRKKRFATDMLEIVKLQLRFDYEATPADNQRKTIFGIPTPLLGIVHTEGWGHGPNHLIQPDELIAIESIRRRLNLENKIRLMMLWGTRDFQSGERRVPTIEEIYISDDELQSDDEPDKKNKLEKAIKGIDGRAGNVPLDPNDWKPHHCMRAVFDTLSKEEQLAVIAAEEDELLIAQGFLPLNETEDDSFDLDDGSIEEETMDDIEDYGDDEDDPDDDDYDSDDDDNPATGLGAQSGFNTLALPLNNAASSAGLLQSTLVSVNTHSLTNMAPGTASMANSDNVDSEATTQPSASQAHPTGSTAYNSFSTWGDSPDTSQNDDEIFGVNDLGSRPFGVRTRTGAFVVPRGRPNTRFRYRKPTTAPATALCSPAELESDAPLTAAMQEIVDRHLAQYLRAINQRRALNCDAHGVVEMTEITVPSAGPVIPGAVQAATQGYLADDIPAGASGSSAVTTIAPATLATVPDHGSSQQGAEPPSSSIQGSELEEESYDPAAGLPKNMDMNIFTVTIDSYHQNPSPLDLGLTSKSKTPLLDLLKCMEAAGDPRGDQMPGGSGQQHKKEPALSTSGRDSDTQSTDDASGSDINAGRVTSRSIAKEIKARRSKRYIVKRRKPRQEVLNHHHSDHKWEFPRSGPEPGYPHTHIYEEYDPDRTPYEFRQY